MADRVRITDVSPRDGLQNEPGIIPTADKVRLIEMLCKTGVDEVEVTSFVSPKWVPQLGDAADVLEQLFPWLLSKWPHNWPCLSVLIPNETGLNALWKMTGELRDQLLLRPGGFGECADAKGLLSKMWVDKVSVFASASETFSKKNINATISESIERFRPVVEFCSLLACPVRGYVSCIFACPFEGPIHPQQVANVVKMLVDLRVREIDLGDTIGAGTVDQTVHLLETIRDLVGREWFDDRRITLHLHDTFGHASDCVKAALQLGVRSFDGSVAGLGGCPYASTPTKRAPGNISTETLVRTIHGAGFTTGVDLDRLAEAAAFARSIVSASKPSAPGTTG